jgi:hypothetical protein
MLDQSNAILYMDSRSLEVGPYAMDQLLSAAGLRRGAGGLNNDDMGTVLRLNGIATTARRPELQRALDELLRAHRHITITDQIHEQLCEPPLSLTKELGLWHDEEIISGIDGSEY